MSDQLAPHAAAYTIHKKTQETTIHINGIRTHDLSNRAAADIRLRLLGQVTYLGGEERSEKYIHIIVTFTPEQATKARRGSRCIALLFLQTRC